MRELQAYMCKMQRRAYIAYKMKSMRLFRDIAKKGFLDSKNLIPKCMWSGIQDVRCWNSHMCLNKENQVSQMENQASQMRPDSCTGRGKSSTKTEHRSVTYIWYLAWGYRRGACLFGMHYLEPSPENRGLLFFRMRDRTHAFSFKN